MSKFLNISNHVLTKDQLNDLDKIGFEEIIELPEDLKAGWAQCNPSSYKELCDKIIRFMDDNNIATAHLAGYAPAVVYICMEYTEFADREFWYSHTVRTSEEVTNPDGSVVKRNVFKHEGWFQYPPLGV